MCGRQVDKRGRPSRETGGLKQTRTTGPEAGITSAALAAATTTRTTTAAMTGFGRIRLANDGTDDGHRQQRLQSATNEATTILTHGSNS
jgi:hypothetical protein